MKRKVVRTERFEIRLTAEQKRLLKNAAQSAGGTISEFITQAVLETLAPAVIDLNECRITPEQFKARIAEPMLVLATPSPSPSPEPEEGGDCE